MTNTTSQLNHTSITGTGSTDTLTTKTANAIVIKPKAGRSVVIFGSVHTRNPRHKQFAELRTVFDKFQPQVVLTESGVNPHCYPSATHAIIADGERGFAAYLCRQSEIKVMSGDPPDSHLFDFLMLKFCKRDVIIFFVLRDLVQHIRHRRKKTRPTLQELSDEIKKTSEYLRNVIKLHVSYEYFLKAYESATGKKFVPSHTGLYKRFQNPKLKLSIQNKISSEESRFRDIYTYGTVKRLLKKFDRVLILKGKSHLQNLEKLFRRDGI